LDWTTLQGDQTLEALRSLQLENFLPPSRAIVIGKLWHDFIIINRSMNATLEELKGEKLKSREEPKDKPRRGGTWDDVIRAIDFPRYFFFFFFQGG